MVVNQPNKLSPYVLLKKLFGMENYVLSLKKAKRHHFTVIRISCYHLAIETGRNTRPITQRHKRLCRSCSINALGDEFYFLLICHNFKNQCKLLFTNLYEFHDIKTMATTTTLSNWCITVMEMLKWLHWFVIMSLNASPCDVFLPCPFHVIRSIMLPPTFMYILCFIVCLILVSLLTCAD